MNKKEKKLPNVCLVTMMTGLLVVSVFLSLRFGSAELAISQVINGLFKTDADAAATHIIWVVRLPRATACILAGVGLSVGGLLLQTATDNPLAGPSVIGVNAGAGFATVLCLCLFPMYYRLLPLAAFFGALMCTFLILFTANKTGGSKVTVLLAGVAVSALLNAGISLLKLIFPDAFIAYNYFSVGGVSGVTFDELFVPAIIILAVLIASAILSAKLNLLCLGDTIARSLGVRVKLIRTLALIMASASAAAAVSFGGLLGFVGLMVPHLSRRLTGGSNLKRLIPVSALMGATIMLLADLLGRTLFAPSEVPAGIITAFIGAPFFFILLIKRRHRL